MQQSNHDDLLDEPRVMMIYSARQPPAEFRYTRRKVIEAILDARRILRNHSVPKNRAVGHGAVAESSLIG